MTFVETVFKCGTTMTRGAKRDALPGRRFDGNACGYLRRQHAVAVFLALEQFPRRHADHARIDSLCLQLLISSNAQRLRCRLCAVGFGDVEQGGKIDIDQVADLLNRYVSLMPPPS